MQESGALIEITTEVREAVRRSADAGLRATPSRVETGGILTGNIHHGRLLINAAEQVRCDHKYGAAYQLSPEECDQMRLAAESIRSSRTRQIAGYFRSCVGDRFKLFPDDEIIVREVLPEAQFILLARPLAAGVSMARLFERDAEGSWAEAAHFELVPSMSRALVPARGPAPKSQRQSVKWLPIVGGLVVVMLLMLAWYQSSVRRSAPIRNASALGMRISTQGDGFWLTWDRNSAAVQQASDGVLRIRDGGGHRDIPLDVGQVQNGSVLYRPQFGDVSFQLELHRNGVILASENIRALDASKPAVAADGGIAPGPGAANTAPPAQSSGTTFRRTRAANAPIEPSQPQALSSAPVSSQPVEAAREPAVPSKPPITVIENSASSPLVIPPGPLIPDAPQSVPLRIPAAEARTPPPPQSPPQVTPKQQPPVTTEQAAKKEQPKVIATSAPSPQLPAPAPQPAPVQQAAEPALVTPPEPVRKVMPNLRSIAPQLLFDTTNVDVQVSIDAAGRVVEAHAINTGKKINQAVVGEAVKAAMQWTFEPAKHRGKPIPATHVITFRFPRAP